MGPEDHFFWLIFQIWGWWAWMASWNSKKIGKNGGFSWKFARFYSRYFIRLTMLFKNPQRRWHHIDIKAPYRCYGLWSGKRLFSQGTPRCLVKYDRIHPEERSIRLPYDYHQSRFGSTLKLSGAQPVMSKWALIKIQVMFAIYQVIQRLEQAVAMIPINQPVSW